MIVAIMQPYFFPYIGYFQLMQAVDTFVFFDDVQYIDRGWVNRNQIPINGNPVWLTMPIRKASRRLPINKREYLLAEGALAIKRKLRSAYRTTNGISLLDSIEGLLDFNDANVARFNANLLRIIAGWLEIKCCFVCASELMTEDESLRGEARVIELCKRLGARQYINLIGGVRLYEPTHFSDSGIKLSFLRTTVPPLQTADGPKHFSIIDQLLNLELKEISHLLQKFETQPLMGNQNYS
ncbi:WbqC-like protein family protein [Thiorhodovibrio winogradskyi]|uniref:WbqC-like protein family protein n=1 Tax=Thiorhodovibrio winogradskyi TaxID=77007 RepID=A0ABZ0SBB3_9GAMM|nr:WbqC family protein [Thiorhodovibrio winogradskyi]